MAATITEKLGSGGKGTKDEELLYTIQGTDVSATAYNLLVATAPALSNGKVLDNLAVKNVEKSTTIWIGTASYVNPDDKDEPTAGTSQYSFNTAGGSRHVTQSIATTKYAPAGKTAPDYKGAVGATADGEIQGVDIDDAIYSWSYTISIAAAKITNAYKARLAEMTNTVNNAAFDGHDASTVRFMGASGSARGDGAYDVTFSYQSIENVTGQTIGTITSIAKKGWEYLWVLYGWVEDAVSKKMVKQPVAVYVEQVYTEDDFAKLDPDYSP